MIGDNIKQVISEISEDILGSDKIPNKVSTVVDEDLLQAIHSEYQEIITEQSDKMIEFQK